MRVRGKAVAGAAAIAVLLGGAAPAGAGTGSGEQTWSRDDTSVTVRVTAAEGVFLATGAKVRVDAYLTFDGESATLQHMIGKLPEPDESYSGLGTFVMRPRNSHLQWTAPLTRVSATHAYGYVDVGSYDARTGTWDVGILTDATVRFGEGPEAYDVYRLDDATIATTTIRRNSKVSVATSPTSPVKGKAVTVKGRVTRVSDSGSFGTAVYKPVPGARVNLYFDPAGSRAKKRVATVVTSLEGRFARKFTASSGGVWTAEVIQTSEHVRSVATRSMRLR